MLLLIVSASAFCACCGLDLLSMCFRVSARAKVIVLERTRLEIVLLFCDRLCGVRDLGACAICVQCNMNMLHSR